MVTSVPQWPMPALQVDWAQSQGTQRSGSWEVRSWGFLPLIWLTPDLGSVTPRNSELHNPLRLSKLLLQLWETNTVKYQAVRMQSQNNHAKCRKPDKDRHMTSGSIYIKPQLICRDKMIRVCWGTLGVGREQHEVWGIEDVCTVPGVVSQKVSGVHTPICPVSCGQSGYKRVGDKHLP